jgi:hypothetical protein
MTPARRDAARCGPARRCAMAVAHARGDTGWKLSPQSRSERKQLVDSGDLPEDTEFDLVVRISAHVYNYLGQYERLASILAGFAGVNRPPG